MNELLTPEEMSIADHLSVTAGPYSDYTLMKNAGGSVFSVLLQRFPATQCVAVFCGPGNNGGDGYVVARLLDEAGLNVTCFRATGPQPNSSAFMAAADYRGVIRPFDHFVPNKFDLIVDGLYGAGLTRPIEGWEHSFIEATTASGIPIIAIDLPSGISGKTGMVMGTAFHAELTVTFFRKKPGHLLQPGRRYCGELIVANIGINNEVLETIKPSCFENTKQLWHSALPVLAVDTHKYRRGHVAIFSGGFSTTGASRLVARAAARSGAGAVTILSPPNAMLIHATHLTSIMLRETKTADDALDFISNRKVFSAVLGPGFGKADKIITIVLELLSKKRTGADFKRLVLDADGLTAFEHHPEKLFTAASAVDANTLILTPHEGEFCRLFGPIAKDKTLSKLEKAKHAAKLANAFIVYKGPDTIIAAPDGRSAINSNATPLLATAGSGDVLAGIISGLLAQGMSTFEAICASVWIHAAAACRFGVGLIAEDLPEILPVILEDVL